MDRRILEKHLYQTIQCLDPDCNKYNSPYALVCWNCKKPIPPQDRELAKESAIRFRSHTGRKETFI